MKSNNMLIALSVMFLFLAVTASVVMWSDVSSAAKIAFFAFGYGSGITTGVRIVRSQKWQWNLSRGDTHGE